MHWQKGIQMVQSYKDQKKQLTYNKKKAASLRRIHR